MLIFMFQVSSKSQEFVFDQGMSTNLLSSNRSAATPRAGILTFLNIYPYFHSRSTYSPKIEEKLFKVVKSELANERIISDGDIEFHANT